MEKHTVKKKMVNFTTLQLYLNSNYFVMPNNNRFEKKKKKKKKKNEIDHSVFGVHSKVHPIFHTYLYLYIHVYRLQVDRQPIWFRKSL